MLRSSSNRIRGALWKLAIGVTENRLEKLERLREWQQLDPEETRQLQHDRLEALLQHCYKNVPYYRSVFESERILHEDGTIDIKQFHEIPLLDKDTLRSEFEDLKSDDLSSRAWYRNTSGGSTGEPVTFIQDEEYDDWGRAVTSLFRCWTGYRSSEPWVKLWGSERDLFDERKSIRSRIGDLLRNQTLLNSFRMGPEEMDEYLDRIDEIEPTFILAYVESIDELARYARRNNRIVHSPRAIMTTAGTLYPEMRSTIEDVFDTEVYNRYGSREVGDIACECSEHEGLHVSVPTQYVEILDDNGEPVEPGEPGEVVVTSLTNYSMPLVRYRIGDIAVKAESSCSCECGWPLLSEVKGRVSDVFIAPDGTRVHGEFFTHLFYHEKWVESFQVVQEAVDEIHVKMVTRNSDELQSERKNAVIESIREVMGQCTVTFETLEEIDRTKSGKYRYTVSKVSDINDDY